MKKLLISMMLFISISAFAQIEMEAELIDFIYDMPVVSASLHEQKVAEASSNMTVITQDMIERRGYRNLVEIVQDIPGFDFSTYEDGGGEYPNHGVNRGIGADTGNTKLLILVDGIVQNFIPFNWSTLWTNEQMLHDIQRIEIIQGPGSSVFGANAYSGVINFITKKNFEGFYAKIWGGENATRAIDLHYGQQFGDDIFLSVALRKYNSDGDEGDRYDPGNYFANNYTPIILQKNYDANGVYRPNDPNPLYGEKIRDGFDVSKDDMTLRVKVNNSQNEVGLFFWDKEDGLGSYVTGYEYFANDPRFMYQVHHRGYHLYAQNTLSFNYTTTLLSKVVYRVTEQRPDTGFLYTYRFYNIPKTYHSFSSEGYIEEQLKFKFERDVLIFGAKFSSVQKMPQVVSINQIQDTDSSKTTSSYSIAFGGGGMYQTQIFEKLHPQEYAFYGIWDKKYSDQLSSSLGLRFDHSSEFGSTINPRIGIIGKPILDKWNVKLLYGSAFQQPSVFQLTDEFRKNPDLEPEKIGTFELENALIFSKSFHAKINIFYSELSDFISVVPDPTRVSGEKFDNVGESWVRGFSITSDYQPIEKLSLYFNYIMTEGKDEDSGWDEINHVAKHKFNTGFNWMTLNDKCNINFRLNYVGKKKAPVSNAWLNRYENGYSPSYTIANLTLTFPNLFRNTDLVPQLIIKNLFDEEYYGIGRQSGSGDSDAYDPVTNVNPIGFSPAYHPQPGRTFYFAVRYKK